MRNAFIAPHKIKTSEAGRAIALAIGKQYQPASAKNMQDAFRDILAPCLR